MDISINILNSLKETIIARSPSPDFFRVNITTSNDPFQLLGVHKVAQIVAKVLLTTKGTDTFAPEVGTGIRSLTGRLVSQSNIEHIRRDIGMWISDSEKQLREFQESGTFPLDERIEKLTLVSADFDFEDLSWTIVVKVDTEAGSQVVVDIGPQIGSPADDVPTVDVRDVLLLASDFI